MRIILIIYIFFGIGTIAVLATRTNQSTSDRLTIIEQPKVTQQPVQTQEKILPARYVIDQPRFISQTYNNCGPASLSMVMSMLGKDVSQEELGEQMRPYQVPGGDNDDKSIFADEFVTYAKKYGFESLHRPNGTIGHLKEFTANDIPVVVRTWLNPQEDIGHFRVVRGYDEERQVLIQDDSYQGENLEYDYDTFLSLWQPFNYGYILVYPKEKQAVVEKILGDEINEKVAFKNAIRRAEKEIMANENAVYPYFNISSASYYLGDYKTSVEMYEKIAIKLPWRMLWYQFEPIQAYQKTGDTERVLRLTEAILNNNNRAFSELYYIRGQMYEQQRNKDAARTEFEKALFYNKNYIIASKALDRLNER